MLVHAFVTSRLDYCNSLLAGASKSVTNRLQLVLNAAARLVTNTRRHDHITPVLRDLYWLPLPERVIYKLCLLVYKCLHGLAPAYLIDCCLPVTHIRGRSQLRSASKGDLAVSKMKTATYGGILFQAAAPLVWNKLPADLRNPQLSVYVFKTYIKTYLFRFS